MSQPYHHIDLLLNRARELEGEDIEQAYDLASQAFEHAENLYEQGAGEALLMMASINEQRGSYKASIEQAGQALALFEMLHSPKQVAHACYLLGWNYYNLGEYATGMTWAARQVKLTGEINDLQGQADAYNLLATLYGEMPGNDEQSIYYYQQSLQLARQLEDKHQEAILLNNLCITYEGMERYEEAREHGETGLLIACESANVYAQTLILGNLGIVYTKTKNYVTALDYYNQRLSLARQANYRTLEAHTLLSLGRLYVRTEEFEKALPYLQEVLLIAGESGYRKWIYAAHEQLALVYEYQQQFEDALRHYRLFHQIEREVLNEQSREQVERLKIATDLEKIQLDLTREREQREKDLHYFQQITQLKDSAINSASHDLKNPLSSIFISLHSLRRAADSSLLPLIERIDHAAKHMQSMIYQILDKAAVEIGKANTYQTISLTPYLHALISDVQVLAVQKEIELLIDPLPLTVLFDADRMRQALNNLLSNAIKYTPPEGVVRLMVEQKANTLILKVSDTGMGIPSEALPHVFQPFYRAHTHIEGTGLGLSIVKAIIDQHNGTIEVSSVEGEGTTFTITLPKVIYEEAQISPAP
jgi:signal transduction histidine kinase